MFNAVFGALIMLCFFFIADMGATAAPNNPIVGSLVALAFGVLIAWLSFLLAKNTLNK